MGETMSQIRARKLWGIQTWLRVSRYVVGAGCLTLLLASVRQSWGIWNGMCRPQAWMLTWQTFARNKIGITLFTLGQRGTTVLEENSSCSSSESGFQTSRFESKSFWTPYPVFSWVDRINLEMTRIPLFSSPCHTHEFLQFNDVLVAPLTITQNSFYGLDTHLTEHVCIRRSRKRRPSYSQEDLDFMDECTAALVLMSLSCSPHSPRLTGMYPSQKTTIPQLYPATTHYNYKFCFYLFAQ